MSQDQKKPGGFSKAPKKVDAPAQEAQNLPDVQGTIENIGKVKVIHGANDDEFAIAGATVAQVRANLVDAFNIPGDALAFVNGEQVDANHVLKSSEVLEFVKAAGVKGFFEKF
ncbi:MAG: hypothetical protein WCG45_00995 [bacterium]